MPRLKYNGRPTISGVLFTRNGKQEYYPIKCMEDVDTLLSFITSVKVIHIYKWAA
jgi:hypothetical protein